MFSSSEDGRPENWRISVLVKHVNEKGDIALDVDKPTRLNYSAKSVQDNFGKLFEKGPNKDFQ